MAATVHLKHSARARYMRLTVRAGGGVVLTVPRGVDETIIQKFLDERREWIDRSVRKMQNFKTLPVSGRRDYLKHKEAARAFVRERVAFWNTQYRFPFGRIAIKNTRLVWGSCSHKGNLNFSYALLFLPRELADYIVVHEICHLVEHNHSQAFWSLVERTVPDYRSLRAQLRRYVRID